MVLELENFDSEATVRGNPAAGVLSYAERLLQIWQACDAREGKLS